MRPLKKMEITESSRRTWATALMHGGWWGALGMTALSVTDSVARPLGVLVVLFIGIAIAAGASRSRMRLADTIMAVFQTGLTASVALQSNTAPMVSGVCTIVADLEGRIQTAERTEVVGWINDELIDRSFEDIIPDRFLRLHLATFKQFRDSDPSRTAGVTFDIPLLREDGEEILSRMTVARIGDTLVATISATPLAMITNSNVEPVS